jgi:hypothetical protein
MAAGALLMTACAADPTTGPNLRQAGGPSLLITGPTDYGTQTCPADDGWTKKDAGSGNETGTWGSLVWSARELTVNVNSGFTVELCVKSGSKAGDSPDDKTLGYTITGPEVNGKITIAQDISHVSYRPSGTPETPRSALSVQKTAAGTAERDIKWTLEKTVDKASVEGIFGGSAGPVVWTVKGTKTYGDYKYKVAGTITITNTNAIPVAFTVSDLMNDGTEAAVTCPSNTVGAGSVQTPTKLVCAYTAAPTSDAATLNTATVTVTTPNVPQGDEARADVAWSYKNIGDESVDLTDDRFSGSWKYDADFTKTFAESFLCSSNIADYIATGSYSKDVTNNAFLKGEMGTDLTDDAATKYTCKANWKGETATVKGLPWDKTNRAPINWFMYATAASFASATNNTLPLIAGQHYTAGSIQAIAGATTTTFTITLNSGFYFNTGLISNVKIHPISDANCASNPIKINYIQPGQYQYKSTVTNISQSTFISQAIPNASCYGIHVDVLRLL